MERGLGMMQQLDREYQIPVEHEIIRYLRERTGHPELFLYKSRLTGAWVICEWFRKDRGWFRELWALDSLGQFDRRIAERFDWWAKADHYREQREYVDYLRGMARADARHQDDENREGADAMKSLRKAYRCEDHPMLQGSSLPFTMG